MTQDYTYYKLADYLSDDFFIQSMTSPTPESKLFWSELIDGGTINVDEFLLAGVFFETLQKNRPQIDSQRADRLLQRINATRNVIQRKHRKMQLYRWLAIAACFAVLIGGPLIFLLGKTDREPDRVHVPSMVIKQTEESEIHIISGEQQIKIDGVSADIRYRQDGSLVVNDRMTVKKETAPKSRRAAGKQSYNQLSVPYGKRAQLTLPDGSVLYVNSGTVVTYPAVFGEDKREIYIKGEIYAEVRKNENSPFIVGTDSMKIQVLGTSFNVSAYPEDRLERVVLVSGTVDVSIQGNKLHLKPNQAYTRTGKESTVETVDVEQYISWRDGIYIFRDESIEHILLRLARYYNVTMILPEQSSGAVCSGKLEMKDDISNLLNGLSGIASFNYAMKDGEYRIQFY
jgi:hypothetical protein